MPRKNKVLKRRPRKGPHKLPKKMADKMVKPGQVLNPAGAPAGKMLMTRIRELLRERSLKKDGTYDTRFDDVANAFIKQMEKGNFPHLREFIEREEGKVVTRVGNADGENIKLYVGMPVEADNPETP